MKASIDPRLNVAVIRAGEAANAFLTG